jgi:hypothetical protein
VTIIESEFTMRPSAANHGPGLTSAYRLWRFMRAPCELRSTPAVGHPIDRPYEVSMLLALSEPISVTDQGGPAEPALADADELAECGYCRAFLPQPASFCAQYADDSASESRLLERLNGSSMSGRLP